MAYKEIKNGSYNVTTTKSSSFFDKQENATWTTKESWTTTDSQRTLSKKEIRAERKEGFSEFLGISRYFVIFCLILFFIAPVFNDLNQNYTWNVEKEGNTYIYTNPNANNVKSYEDLGNKMLYGFTETLDTIGNISETANNVTTTVGKVTGWFSPVFETAKNMFTGALEWFNGLF